MQYELFEESSAGEKPTASCPVILQGQIKLSKVQAEFNRLNKKIAQIREDLARLPEKRAKISELYEKQVQPLLKEYNQTLLGAVCDLDARYEVADLKEEDQYVLSSIIFDKCNILMLDLDPFSEEEKKATLALHHKHEKIQTGLSDKELTKVKVEGLLHMFTMMTGFQPTAKMKKSKSEEELTELIDAFMQAKMEEEFESQKSEFEKESAFTREERSSEPKQKQKMTQASLKRKMQEEQTLKSIRTVYLELVKELHPDREQDEALRAVKEERMKQLTEAYQQKDLAALLTMQVRWLEETMKVTPGELSDEVLKGYNKILRAQLKKLEEEQQMSQYLMPNLPEDLSYILTYPMDMFDERLDIYLEKEQSALKDIRRIVKYWKTKAGLKKLIREQRLENELANYLDELAMNDLMRAMMSGKVR